MTTYPILGIPFSSMNEMQVLDLILDKIELPDQQLFIATPNPEMILESIKDKDFKKLLQNTSFNIPDGIGILWAATYLNASANAKSHLIKFFIFLKTLFYIPLAPKKIRKMLPKRVTGTDMMQIICSRIPTTHSVFLLGAAEGVAKTAGAKINQRYGTNIAGSHAGSPAPDQENRLRDLINHSGADILFVAYGSPAQEFWIKRNLPKLHNIKLAMGIGGAFDFIAGTKKRAPAILRKTGLEWFFRLIIQPSRFVRIFNATVKFPLTVFLSSIQKK